MAKRNKNLKDFMTPAQRTSMGNSPTWHSICTEKTGVARPGKTARDRAKRDRR
jgi:hypothetical protein